MTNAKATNAKPIRVIHCFRSPVGGLYRHVCDQLFEQFNHGLQIGLICDSTTGGSEAKASLKKLEQYCSLGIYRFPMSRNLSISDAHVLMSQSLIIKKETPDIIHAHGGKGGAYGRLLAKKFGVKTIYTPHGGSLHYDKTTPAGLVYLTLEKILKRWTDGLIFESKFSADTYKCKIGRLVCPSQVIHNGLRDNEFIPVNNDKPNMDFVFVGELRKLKGLEVLLQAISLLQADQSVRTLIYGAGPDEVFFKNLAEKLGIKGLVTFLPPIFPSTKAFAHARCVVIPSLAESFPYIVLEAIAAKKPILTTRVGGIAEIFGPHAKLLIPSNDPDALAKSMQKMIEEPQTSEQFTELLQNHVKSNFKTVTMVKQTIEFYRRVLNGPVFSGSTVSTDIPNCTDLR